MLTTNTRHIWNNVGLNEQRFQTSADRFEFFLLCFFKKVLFLPSKVVPSSFRTLSTKEDAWLAYFYVFFLKNKRFIFLKWIVVQQKKFYFLEKARKRALQERSIELWTKTIWILFLFLFYKFNTNILEVVDKLEIE